MSHLETCTRCGEQLTAANQTCPRCLFELALPRSEDAPAEPQESSSVDPAAATPPSMEEVARALPEFDGFAPLGRGGMGAVFRARERALDRAVAIKVLPRALGEQPAFRERFLREARTLARLDHPNVVGVFGAGEAQGLCYLVMELVDGRNLREVMRERRVEPSEALRIVRALCDALQYAHDEGVVHRDIKPENVLLDRAQRVKIADFGLAKLVSRDGEPTPTLTRTDQVMGTPHYMAPEQLERPRDVDHRADLFAVGVILYELLTGSLPRGAFEPPSRRVAVDVRLDEIVLKALEREPMRRYQHALEVKSDVERVESNPGAAPEAIRREKTASERGIRMRAAGRGDPLGAGRGFAIWAAAWVLVAAAWNLGAFAFGVASFAFISMAAALTAWRAPKHGVDPHAPRQPSESSKASAAACFTAAFALIAVAHVAHWERGTRAWFPVFRGQNAQLDAARVDTFATARSCGIDTLSIDAPVLRLASSSTSKTIADLGATMPWALFLVAFALLAAGARGLVPSHKAAATGRAPWGFGLAIASEMFGALVLWWVVAPMLALREDRVLSDVTRAFELKSGNDEAVESVRRALQELGLNLRVDQRAYLADSRSARPLADLTFLSAASDSPFERWNTSWSGPQRESPTVWASLARAADGDTVYVQLRAGLYRTDTPDAMRAMDALAQIEASVIAR